MTDVTEKKNQVGHSPNPLQRGTAEAGFTLVELMVVIAIIAILATVVTVNVIGRLDDANVTAAKYQINSFKQGIMAYRIKCNRFPTTAEGLEVLINNDKGEKFLDTNEIPKDPWGNPYIYTCDNSREFKIISYGADGQPGGSGVDADIDSTSLNKK